ncbi:MULTISPECIES: hypothetical protein [unclassified Legionella]|uniref:hypothetical protein n=1 Tax=unclassified Legionella TaxID=2622702 RepID=UPI001E301FAC|nr:hypothetical protein [Legionella sp. 31fI33]MCC5014844.1 hypothetical protein [Legionella sp. 31fI33]
MGTRSKTPVTWEEFFKRNPYFGRINSRLQVVVTQQSSSPDTNNNNAPVAPTGSGQPPISVAKIQQFWRKKTSTDTKVKVQAGSAHLPPQAKLMANIRSDKEVKKILEEAARKKRLHTNLVQTILHQPNAIKCAYELYRENKLTKDQFFRITELHKNYIKDEEHVIYKSVNISKIKKLAQLVNNGLRNVNDPGHNDQFAELKEFLKDPTFPEIVVGLYDSNYSHGMQAQQLLTLLELYQSQLQRPGLRPVRNRAGEVEMLRSPQPYITSINRILDENGLFTEEAKKFLLPLLNQPGRLKSVNENNDYEEFRRLVAQLPPSEQIFYTVIASSTAQLTRNVLGESAVTEIPFQLADHFNKLDGVKISDELPLLIPTCGLRNAIGILRYGVDNYIPIEPQFGVKSMTDIEEAYRERHHRLAFLYYPYTPDPGAVHNSPLDTYLGVFAHDKYHSDVVSSMPDYARNGLLRFADIIRGKTGIDWSDELWIWIDADFRYFKSNEVDPLSAPGIVHFCTMLDTLQLPDIESGKPYGQILIKGIGPSSVGLLAMLDMVENKKDWQAIGLDPDLLPDASQMRTLPTRRSTKLLHKPLDYKKYFTRIEEMVNHHQSILAKPPAAQLLEIMVYLSQPNKLATKEISEFGNFVDELQKQGLLKIEKEGINIHLKFAGKHLEYNESLNHNTLHPLILMYKVYRQKRAYWNKDDFVKAYDESNAVMNTMISLLKDNNLKDPAKNILDRIIQTILLQTSNLSTEDISFDTLKKSIDAYSTRQTYLFQTPKEEKKTSDKLLDKVFANAYSYDKKTISLIELIDSITQYKDSLTQEQQVEKQQTTMTPKKK